MEFPVSAAAAGTARRSTAKAAPEQGLEEIAVLGRFLFAEAAAGAFRAGVPVRWRTEILPGLPVGAQSVISAALLRILEHFIGFADVLEARFGARLLAQVRMVFAGQPPVRLLDVIGAGIPCQAHHLVVVLVFHGSFPQSTNLLPIAPRAGGTV